jgi:hypothetical protein
MLGAPPTDARRLLTVSWARCRQCFARLKSEMAFSPALAIVVRQTRLAAPFLLDCRVKRANAKLD